MRTATISAIYVCLAGLAVQGFAARGGLRVNESATRLSFEEGETRVELVVQNDTGQQIAGHVKLELVDSYGEVQARAQIGQMLPSGATTVGCRLAFNFWTLTKDDQRRTLWYRLRYSISSVEASRNAKPPVSGTISISEVTPDFFDLSVITPMISEQAARYHVRVRAAHPVSSRPISGVTVEAEITTDQSGVTHPKATGATNEHGYAVFAFDLPRCEKKCETRLKAVGSLGGLIQEVEREIRFDRTIRVTVSTDKLIYQPGQTLHVRALALDPGRRAFSAKELTLKIEDPEDTVLYRVVVKTSRFGIASADWPIPDNARLGDYQIRLHIDEGDEEAAYSPPIAVKISRYELPTFTVRAKSDHGFYLPGNNAEVEVRGDYLFGRPVLRGHVRVVRETSREWNYREQEWETEEQDKYEGELDKNGTFVARVDLAKEHAKFEEEAYGRIRDITYAAYLTDATTGRTEQRRFDLRLTKEPIHVYCIEGTRGAAEGDSVEFYVSTYYADGEPAVCDIKISQDTNQRNRALRTVRTNRYGLAKITGLWPVVNAREASLSLVARDRHGRLGHETENIAYWSSSAIRVDTNKTIYRTGQPIKLAITSYQPHSSVFVDVARDGKVIRSLEVRLRNGEAQFSLPYADDFKDELTIAAFTHSVGLVRGFDVATRTVLYPRDRQLKLDVQMNRDEYRPGHEAVAGLRVRTADGNAVESALGVSVTDEAVDERTRADTEFGSRNYFYHSFQRMWGDDESIGGVTRASLDRLDLSKAVSDDLDLVAEVLLRRRGYWPEEYVGDGFSSNIQNLFYLVTERQLKPVKAAIASRYARTGEYPRDRAMLHRLMSEFGIAFDQMLDPWGLPYIAKFSTRQCNDVLDIKSAGPDKRPGTADDFTAARLDWPYFKDAGQAIDRAVLEYHRRTRGHIRDSTTLKRELRLHGVIFDSLRDRWGRLYRLSLDVERTRYVVNVRSGGENKRFEPGTKAASDDFILWSSSIDYSIDLSLRLNTALHNFFNATGRFPENDQQFDDALRRAGIERSALRDPWSRLYYVSFRTQSRYSDHVKVYSYAAYKDEVKQKTEITPVTQQVNFIYLRSAGEDGKEGTADDFDLANFSRVVVERPRTGADAQPVSAYRPMAGGTGSITGVVVDQSGAVVPNATVKAQKIDTALEYETKSDEGGRYLFANVAPGSYRVRFEAHGFSALVIDTVPVQPSSATEVNANLSPSGITETVNVTAEAAQTLQTSATEISGLALKGRGRIQIVTKSGGEQVSTPRLREYFPETLLWEPSIETDASGLAQVKFKLADNITTWKMSVVASTLDGEVSTVEQNIVAFQPFFVEHDPPRVLTEADRIALPVILRNYLEKPQSVELRITPADWFKLLGPSTKRAEVAAGDTRREVFDFQAVSSTRDARQRITASGSDASDAIEKPVTVHPDGEETTRTAAQVIRDTSTIEIEIPSNAIHGSTAAELKIYPNLMAHVLESVEAILQRPYGCAEQTISAAYPGLLVLQSKKTGADVPAALVQKADRYVRAGYEKLLGYRTDDGAFSYWGRGGADSALTAYAVRFLTAAGEVVAIDEDVIRNARDWLIKQQRADGSWPEFDWNQKEDRKRTMLLTAYIARVLSKASKIGADDRDTQTERANAAAVKKTLKYLSERVEEIDEPYLLASYALAAASAGHDSDAASATAQLRTLALSENAGSYWSLETNTPFYGWGLAGRIETTALAVQALAVADKLGKSDASARLIDSGLLFLLRQTDRYGVWYSTQATINVLESLMTALERSGPGSAAGGPAEIIVNGRRAAAIEMPASRELANPISLDLSGFVAPGANRVEIRRASGSSQASARIVTTHWEPWPANTAHAEPGPLQLRVSYDKTETKIGDEVTCTVEAERVGFRGYGMMLAEIGLPPGADVDRASLDTAMRESDWSVQQYDVLPDRVVVYLWPRAGGVKFRFNLKLRYGLEAQTASSVLYDYYNPEARVVVRPTHFVVK